LLCCFYTPGVLSNNDGNCWSSGIKIASNSDALTLQLDGLTQDEKTGIFSPASSERRINNQELFCQCNEANIERRWVTKTVWEGEPTPDIIIDGVHFFDPGKDIPFYVGAEIEIAGNSYKKAVPHETIGKGDSISSCGGSEATQYNAKGSLYNDKGNRSLKTLFYMKPNFKGQVAGSHSFILPNIKSYRRLAPIAETLPQIYSAIPETIFNMSTMNVIIQATTCTVTGESLLSISMGAIDTTELQNTAIDEKPSNYTPQNINIKFQCGNWFWIAPYFKLVDELSSESFGKYALTTTLEGIGIALTFINVNGEETLARVGYAEAAYGTALPYDSNRNATFEAWAYPIKIKEEFEVGTYKAKATLTVHYN